MDSLLQYKEDGKLKFGLLREGFVYDISDKWASLKDLLEFVGGQGKNLVKVISEIDVRNRKRQPYQKTYSKLLSPIFSDKIYGLGITYKASEINRVRRSKDSAHKNAVRSGRLVSFYKGDFHNCVGPNQLINIRGDSKLSTPEPELAAIISSKAEILGYTIFNDVTAYDLEMASSLFTPEAKEYIGCCSAGPFFAPKKNFSEIPNLKVKLKIIRNGKLLLKRSSKTDLIRDKPQKLIDELCKYRHIPNGTLVALGSSIIVPGSFSLKGGDEVLIEIEQLGVLKNKVKSLK